MDDDHLQLQPVPLLREQEDDQGRAVNRIDLDRRSPAGAGR